jgi:hypothetical protein
MPFPPRMWFSPFSGKKLKPYPPAGLIVKFSWVTVGMGMWMCEWTEGRSAMKTDVLMRLLGSRTQRIVVLWCRLEHLLRLHELLLLRMNILLRYENRNLCERIRVNRYVLGYWWMLWEWAKCSNRRYCWSCTVLKLIADHMIGESVCLDLGTPFTGVFCLFDTVRYLYHKGSIVEMRIVSADLSHSFIGRLFDFLLMTVFDILVQGTAALADLAKVLVTRNVLGTDIAEDMLVGSHVIAQPKNLPLHILAVRARHLVATIFFHKRVLAAIALPNQCCGHGLFHDVS